MNMDNTSVQDLHDKSNAETDRRVGIVFRTMLLFTIMMVLGPISTYFLSKTYVWEGFFQIASDSSYIYSAISSIVVVHVILGAYIWIAWLDATSDRLSTKKKQ